MGNEYKNKDNHDEKQKTAADNTHNDNLNDRGDLGKKGSMEESFRSEEGYFTMDEDEKKEDNEENNNL